MLEVAGTIHTTQPSLPLGWLDLWYSMGRNQRHTTLIWVLYYLATVSLQRSLKDWGITDKY